MLLCHFSDWRGRGCYLPHADVYVCTGSMLPLSSPGIRPVEHAQVYAQGKFIREHTDYRERYLENKDAPIILVRGRTDFANPCSLFGGRVYEIGTKTSVAHVHGLTFGGFRGSSETPGRQNRDEMDSAKAEHVLSKLRKDLDVIVTHTPPYGVKDSVSVRGARSNLGLAGLSETLTQRLKDSLSSSAVKAPRLHCFGMVPNQKGFERKPFPLRPKLDISYSNTAGGWAVLKQQPDSGWTVVNLGYAD